MKGVMRGRLVRAKNGNSMRARSSLTGASSMESSTKSICRPPALIPTSGGGSSVRDVTRWPQHGTASWRCHFVYGQGDKQRDGVGTLQVRRAGSAGHADKIF